MQGERQAGRELDLEVAEKVFGYVVGRAPCGDGLTRTDEFEGETLADVDVQIRAAYPKFIEQGGRMWPAQFTGPEYSTDIAAAWLVVEKLHEMGLYVSISKPPNAFTWDVRGWNEATNDNRFIAHAETAPLTICIAALVAAGASKGEPTPDTE